MSFGGSKIQNFEVRVHDWFLAFTCGSLIFKQAYILIPGIYIVLSFRCMVKAYQTLGIQIHVVCLATTHGSNNKSM